MRVHFFSGRSGRCLRERFALYKTLPKRLKKTHIKLDQGRWNLNFSVLEALASFRGISSQQWWGKLKWTQKKLEWRTCPGSPCFCWRLKSNRGKVTHPEKSGKLTGAWKQFLFLACRWNFGVWRNCTTGVISPYICQMKRYWLSTGEDLGIPNFLLHTKLLFLLLFP